MSQRFIRCGHCGLPHDVNQQVCPVTGKAIARMKGRKPDSSPQPRRATPAHAQPPKKEPGRHPPASAAPSKHPQRDLFGKTIGGKYVIRNILGEGGMGTVFEAEHITIGRVVAVKVLHPNQARKKDAVRRFHQEARAAGAIGHPNICEVYDLGTLDDWSPYLVMERLIGETLADRIAAEGGLPFDDVIDILVQVLSGLVAAHEKGIVHRDIKPENVFLTRRVGCPPICKLLDFGVSKVTNSLIGGRDDDLELTRTGMVMGTPYYMSPEQARGDRNLDARVDLYATGVIFYEALTGRRPFTAANYNALLLQILSAKPKAARDLRPALPAAFDPVLDKAMARNRDERYGSAAEFQADLKALRDRHSSGPSVLGAALRALEAPAPALAERHPWSPALQASPATPAPAARSEPGKELSASSVDIPIVVSGDTPLSGEHLPVEVTEAGPRPRVADGSEGDEYPTQVETSPFHEVPTSLRSSSDHVPSPAGRSGVQDTDVTGRPAAANDTDPTGPAPTNAPPEHMVPPEVREEPDTIVKSNTSFPLAKRRAGRRSGNPNDTGHTQVETEGEGDPTQLFPSRAPKAPRR